jgi:integrase
MTDRLTNKEILALKTLGRHSLGDNLFLRCRTTSTGKLSRAFEFKWIKNGVEQTRGLGSILLVSPAKARLKAARARLTLDEGNDPFPPKQAPAPAATTLRMHAMAFIESKGAGWKPKHRAQWIKTVDCYLAPIADMPIAAIDTPAVVGCLEPLMTRIPATAAKTRGVLEQVLASATSLGLRSGPNPAAWKNHLENILHKERGEQAHHAAMPYDDLPDFLRTLRANPSIPALALEFTILAAARSGEVRFATWDEIDLANRVWTVRANRTKSGREHRVPLCDRCCAILESLPHRPGFVFPGTQPNAPLGKMALNDLVPSPATCHGMRSVFRDWAAEETKHPREIAEHALAHSVGNGTEKAYRRGDAFKHRRELMDEWASFCVYGSRKVLPLRA